MTEHTSERAEEKIDYMLLERRLHEDGSSAQQILNGLYNNDTGILPRCAYELPED